jgi:hypothetical protein
MFNSSHALSEQGNPMPTQLRSEYIRHAARSPFAVVPEHPFSLVSEEESVEGPEEVGLLSRELPIAADVEDCLKITPVEESARTANRKADLRFSQEFALVVVQEPQVSK